MKANYDIIGDVHGFVHVLRALLFKLGYEVRGGVFRHPTRKAIFIGDFIDAGPENLEVVSIVRRMVEAGSGRAIMGNHEFNALGFHSIDIENDGGFLREHSEKNINQHRDFLEEQTVRHREAGEALEWFKTLPLFIEEDGVRVVHAAWHQPTIDTIKGRLNPDNSMPTDFFRNACVKGTDEYNSVEMLLKGPEHDLPEGIAFLDRNNFSRTEARIAWWKSGSRVTYKSGIIGAKNANDLPDVEMPSSMFSGFNFDSLTPLTFFGHYHAKGKPESLTSKLGCVDYDVSEEGGILCCYRWSGEKAIENANFVHMTHLGSTLFDEKGNWDEDHALSLVEEEIFSYTPFTSEPENHWVI